MRSTVKVTACLALGVLLICTQASTAPATPQAKTLWDRWYTLTIEPNIRYGYYNEKAESRGETVFLQTQIWKKEEDFINQEQMGVLSKSDLTPVAYNFRSTYRSTETTLDGTIDEQRVLNLKLKISNKPEQSVKKQLPQNVIFSSAFPLWVGKNIGRLKPKTPISFQAFLEDSPHEDFRMESGIVIRQEPDTLAKSMKLNRLSVRFRNQDSTWWVREQGDAHQIHLPAQKIWIKEVSKDVALKYLMK
jgi:hypothetical protein